MIILLNFKDLFNPQQSTWVGTQTPSGNRNGENIFLKKPSSVGEPILLWPNIKYNIHIYWLHFSFISIYFSLFCWSCIGNVTSFFNELCLSCFRCVLCEAQFSYRFYSQTQQLLIPHILTLQRQDGYTHTHTCARTHRCSHRHALTQTHT